MITLRKEQYAAFEKNEVKKFEDPTYLYLNERYPEQCQDFGETHVRRLIRYGVQRAASYAIGNTNEVRIYIEVIMLLGKDFDKDPQYPWAETLLKDRSAEDPKARTDRLLAAAMKCLSEKA